MSLSSTPSGRRWCHIHNCTHLHNLQSPLGGVFLTSFNEARATSISWTTCTISLASAFTLDVMPWHPLVTTREAMKSELVIASSRPLASSKESDDHSFVPLSQMVSIQATTEVCSFWNVSIVFRRCTQLVRPRSPSFFLCDSGCVSFMTFSRANWPC